MDEEGSGRLDSETSAELDEEGSERLDSETSAELVSEMKENEVKVDDGGRSIGESQRSGSIEKSMIKSSVRRLGLDPGWSRRFSARGKSELS